MIIILTTLTITIKLITVLERLMCCWNLHEFLVSLIFFCFFQSFEIKEFLCFQVFIVQKHKEHQRKSSTSVSRAEGDLSRLKKLKQRWSFHHLHSFPLMRKKVPAATPRRPKVRPSPQNTAGPTPGCFTSTAANTHTHTHVNTHGAACAWVCFSLLSVCLFRSEFK